MNENTENNGFISIYDFLGGTSAGSIDKNLGYEIYKLSKKNKIKISSKQVPWSNHENKRILIYPYKFLVEAFSNNKIKNLIKNEK